MIATTTSDSKPEEEIKRIAIDGGPCSGKTTGMAKIVQALQGVGIIPVTVPEAATMLMAGGIAPWTMDIIDFQEHASRLQVNLETTFMTGARELGRKHGRPAVLITDRGLVGQAAYLPGTDRLKMLNDLLLGSIGMSVEAARARYAGVIHLVTAADGAEDSYTLTNNAQRKESPEEARAVDRRTQEAWLGHSHLAIVPNRDRDGRRISFEEKMRRTVAEVFRILGFPQPIEDEERYWVEPFDLDHSLIRHEKVRIWQAYLAAPSTGAEERIRERRWLGSSTYYHTVKTPTGDGRDFEPERMITLGEFNRLRSRIDRDSTPIEKDRYYFIWHDQYFEADMYLGRHAGLYKLEREKTDRNESTVMPPFIKVIRDVTHDTSFRNRALAARSWSIDSLSA
ncbi:MAG: AAA family ATPase [Patescibacteria group bacterium]|nr:AAA family ATPase [Patescibacteria group bacterium]MDE2116289.1 AAA family ATPase [Patescibacteria group bacterium]